MGYYSRPIEDSLREWGERRSTRVFALKIAQKRLEFEGVCTVTFVVQSMPKTIGLLCITVSAGRSRSVKNAADTKLFAAPGLAKSKYRRFSRSTSPVMHKRRYKNQAGMNGSWADNCQMGNIPHLENNSHASVLISVLIKKSNKKIK